MELKNKIAECRDFVQSRSTIKPRIAIILGTGLGALVEHIKVLHTFAYTELPHFVESTVETHSGKMLLGNLAGVEVVCFQGRFHLYEGYSFEQITFPVRMAKALGCEALFVSNACGNLNPQFSKGDLMLIDDHINLLGTNPLIGPNDPTLGERFPDMSEPYSKNLQELARSVALQKGLLLQKGVYACMSGPSLETRAEYRMLRLLGADVIGMSTVPEVIVARHAGLSVLGVSVLTDDCFPESLRPVALSEIIEVAGRAEPALVELFKGVIARWNT